MVEPSAERNAQGGDGADSNTTAAVERAERAFAAGDHRAVRRELAGLPAIGDGALRARADELVRGVSADPAFIAVVVVCAVGLFGIFAHYVLRGGA